MVALVAETGAGLSNANSYADVAFADAYYAGHPFYADNWDDLDPSTKAALLMAATRSLDGQYLWYGYRATTTQALEWPRARVRDLYDVLLPQDALPVRLRQAVAEHALWLTKGDRSPEAQTSTGLDRLKIDVIELDFASASSNTSAGTQPVNSATRALLRGLGDYLHGLRVRRVIVG
jgi:hypothetical protein